MSTPYLGTIKPFSFNFAPKGWALCNGQLLAINQNQALFSLLGTTYGGNGINTFALPNLQGCFPLSFSSNYPMGATGGESTHTLITNEMPSHAHTPAGSTNAADQSSPVNNYPAAATGAYFSSTPDTPVSLLNGSSTTGSGQGHENRPPYLAMTYCIALSGIFPSRN